MTDMLLLLVSVVFLVASFMLQKLYQKVTVNIPGSDVCFNIFTAVFSLIVFAFTGGFRVEFSTYSIVNAFLKSVCGLAYLLIGFRILKHGSVALYMLFLMSGGMAVPCVFGWLFLGETVKLFHVIGVIIILIAVMLTNSGAHKMDKKLFFMCTMVFLLNGGVSVFSKLHQIHGKYGAVDTSSYALISAFFSIIISVGLLVTKKKDRENTKNAKSALRIIPLLLIAGYSVVGSIASLFQLIGAKSLPASILYPVVTGGSIVLSGIFGYIFFKEKTSKQAWLGIVLCFVGTCLFV